MSTRFNIALICLFTLSVRAQLPDTDIWLFTIKQNKTGLTEAVSPVNITARPGYDNQPSFTSDGKKIMYSSVREDKQSDIYIYTIKKKKTVQLTRSGESEYSPSLYEDQKIRSVVVEKDSTQRIHIIHSETGEHEKSLSQDSVGYYCFLNPDTLVYFKVGKKHSLWLTTLSGNKEIKLADNPGRSLKKKNRHSVLYNLKDQKGSVIYEYDLLLKKAVVFARSDHDIEEFIFHETYGLLAAEGSRILRYMPDKKQWILFFDLSSAGITKISRFVFDPESRYLAVSGTGK